MVRKFRKRVSGLIKLNKIVYLISPNEINKDFYKSLDKVLSYGNVNFFQLRLKKIKTDRIYQISKKIKKIIGAGHTILLEKLAEKIFQECFKNKRIETMKIRLEKLDAIKEAASAGIEIERSRA